MFIGINLATEERIDIEDAIIEGNQFKYVCPICRGELVLKNGKEKIAHFAHKSSKDCDKFTADMSEWHRNWQAFFHKNNREVVLTLTMSNIAYEGAARRFGFSNMTYNEYMEYKKVTPRKMLCIQHRADVLACGYVIEFQHSPISSKEFNERNWFYKECGYKVIWIFDLREKYEEDYISFRREWDRGFDNGGDYKWNYAFKTLSDFIPQQHRNRYEDGEMVKGDVTIFFQFFDFDREESFMERVVWAIEKDNHSDFKYFKTSYYPGNKKEFKEWVVNKKL